VVAPPFPPWQKESLEVSPFPSPLWTPGLPADAEGPPRPTCPDTVPGWAFVLLLRTPGLPVPPPFPRHVRLFFFPRARPRRTTPVQLMRPRSSMPGLPRGRKRAPGSLVPEPVLPRILLAVAGFFFGQSRRNRAFRAKVRSEEGPPPGRNVPCRPSLLCSPLWGFQDRFRLANPNLSQPACGFGAATTRTDRFSLEGRPWKPWVAPRNRPALWGPLNRRNQALCEPRFVLGPAPLSGMGPTSPGSRAPIRVSTVKTSLGEMKFTSEVPRNASRPSVLVHPTNGPPLATSPRAGKTGFQGPREMTYAPTGLARTTLVLVLYVGAFDDLRFVAPYFGGDGPPEGLSGSWAATDLTRAAPEVPMKLALCLSLRTFFRFGPEGIAFPVHHILPELPGPTAGLT